MFYDLALLFSALNSSIKIEVKVDQLCPTLCNPMDYIVHENVTIELFFLFHAYK